MAGKAKILVVDDDPDTTRLLAEVLERAGAEPVCFESPRRAAERLQQEKIDAAFIDWSMPEMNGLELVEQVRWSKLNSRCPIVLITGVADSATIQKCFRAGINFYLQKPVSNVQVKTLLNATRGVMLQERRRYQRAPVKIPVTCEWSLQSMRQEARGKSVDLSSSGIQVALELMPSPGAVVDLSFSLPDDPKPFRLTGRVVRILPRGQIGVEFADLHPTDQRRLINFTERFLTRTPSA